MSYSFPFLGHGCPPKKEELIITTASAMESNARRWRLNWKFVQNFCLFEEVPGYLLPWNQFYQTKFWKGFFPLAPFFEILKLRQLLFLKDSIKYCFSGNEPEIFGQFSPIQIRPNSLRCIHPPSRVTDWFLTGFGAISVWFRLVFGSRAPKKMEKNGICLYFKYQTF